MINIFYGHSSVTSDRMCTRVLKTPVVKFLELIFRNNFLSTILAKFVRDESCRGYFPPASPKGLVLVAPRDFYVYR